MPGCAAVNCTNSAQKGFLMKRFPKDPQRRKEWAIKTRRDRWSPTDYSCLCEVHFAPEMWESTREDGSRRLRINAVPTIFSFCEETVNRRALKSRWPIKQPAVEQVVKSEISADSPKPINTTIETSSDGEQPSTSQTQRASILSKSASSESFQSLVLRDVASTSSNEVQLLPFETIYICEPIIKDW